MTDDLYKVKEGNEKLSKARSLEKYSCKRARHRFATRSIKTCYLKNIYIYIYVAFFVVVRKLPCFYVNYHDCHVLSWLQNLVKISEKLSFVHTGEIIL